MVAYLSGEWLAALQDAAEADDVLRAATAGASLTVEQHVHGGPGGDAVFHVAVDDGRIRFAAGPAAAPDLTITQPYETAVGITEGRTSPQHAAVVGDLRIDGPIDRLADQARLLERIGDVFAAVRARTEY